MKQHSTLDDQIASLKRRGVQFDLMSEDQARDFLTSNSYFYKLKSYRGNYPRLGDDDNYTYQGLDFGHLVEISNIDFALSRLVLSLSLGIEHALKVRTNQLIMSDRDPDIAEKCVRRVTHGDYSDVHSNPYTQELFSHCKGEYAVWHLWELLSFRYQIDFYQAYYKLRYDKEAPKIHLLYIVRQIRNAVSHGNCLLADMGRLSPSKTEERRDREVTDAALEMCGLPVMRRGKRLNSFTRALDLLVVNNYAAVLLCHLSFVDSAKALEHSASSVDDFVRRVERRREEYFGQASGSSHEKNHQVNSNLKALIQLSRGYVRAARDKAAQATKGA